MLSAFNIDLLMTIVNSYNDKFNLKSLMLVLCLLLFLMHTGDFKIYICAFCRYWERKFNKEFLTMGTIHAFLI